MRRFCFADSSGILKRDRFFGTGLLVVKNIGDMSDKLNKNSQPVKELVKQFKNKKIAMLLGQGNAIEAMQILKHSYHFEMKFDNIRTSVLNYYERMVDIFLSDSDNRFSAMIVDRDALAFDDANLEDSWETYTKYVANLVVREMKNLGSDELCLVVDEITRPRGKTNATQ